MPRRIKSREIAWMVLPVIFIGGVAFWRSRVPMVSTEGQLRVLVGQSHLIEATPLDIGTGYNARIEIPLQLAGATSASNLKQFSAGSSGSLGLEYQLKGQWRSVPEDGDGMFPVLIWTDDRAQYFTEGRSLNWQFPLSFADIPRDAEAIRLKGSALGYSNWALSNRGKKDPFYLTHSAPFTQIIWKRGEAWPDPQISRASSLNLKRTQIGYTDGHTVEPAFVVKWNYGWEKLNSKLFPHIVQCEILDSQNKVLSRFKTNSGVTPPNKLNPNYLVSPQFFWTKIPIEKGALTLESVISVDNEWPLRARMPILTDWMGRRATQIKSSGIRVIPQKNGDVKVTANIAAPGAIAASGKDFSPTKDDFTKWLPISVGLPTPKISNPPRLFCWFERTPDSQGIWSYSYSNNLDLKQLGPGLFSVSCTLKSGVGRPIRKLTHEIILLREGDGTLPIRFTIP